ncbi:TIGR03118 family protein [soil metagenome]
MRTHIHYEDLARPGALLAALLPALAFAGCAAPRAESAGAAPPRLAVFADSGAHADAARAVTGAPSAHTPLRRNAYRQVNLVADSDAFKPQIVDPQLRDGWGIAIRPAGAGGHFWISNRASGNTTTYVGDVPGVPLHQDGLKQVLIPPAKVVAHLADPISQPTGQVYAGNSKTDFQVNGFAPSGAPVTAASNFIFAGLDGTIAAWCDGMGDAVLMLDRSAAGSAFTGLAITEQPSGNRLFIADFGLETVIVLDDQWRPIKTAGDWSDPKAPENFRIYNFQFLDGKVYATWARQGDATGEEDRHPGYGYITVFDTEGRLLQSFEHRMELNAPWGMAIAPADFGALSGALLVGNFGDGTIVAFDRARGTFIDYLRDEAGAPIKIDGLWGILLGNGVRLGRTNHLYFAAGPNDQEDGLFGKLEPLDP